MEQRFSSRWEPDSQVFHKAPCRIIRGVWALRFAGGQRASPSAGDPRHAGGGELEQLLPEDSQEGGLKQVTYQK
jgi:hypothetical protein